MKTHVKKQILMGAALLSAAAAMQSCDALWDTSLDYDSPYPVVNGGVSLNIGSSPWAPAWNSPVWTYPVYRPLPPVVNPIPPTRPGGNWRPTPPPPPSTPQRPPSTPQRPPVTPQQPPQQAPTAPGSGQRPGAH